MSILQIKLKKCEFPLSPANEMCVVEAELLWLILQRQQPMAGSEMRESDMAEFTSIYSRPMVIIKQHIWVKFLI